MIRIVSRSNQVRRSALRPLTGTVEQSCPQFTAAVSFSSSRNVVLVSTDSLTSPTQVKRYHLKTTIGNQYPVQSWDRIPLQSRHFHTTSSISDKDDDKDQTKVGMAKTDEHDDIRKETFVYETINNTDMSMQEIEELIRQEEERLNREEQEKLGFQEWTPGMRKRPLKSSIRLDDFADEIQIMQNMGLEVDTAEDGAVEQDLLWSLQDKRCGALAVKVGMMPVFDEWGVRHPCTLLWMDNNIVVGHKTLEKNGYSAIRVAAGKRKRKNVGKSVLGQYKAIMKDTASKDRLMEQEHPPYLIREFRVTDESYFIPVGSNIHARHFVPGQNVDVSGISKGKGFQGAMKRHNFAGLPASHGVSRSHRALGSTGQCQDPGKVFKGKKMAGRMGTDRVTVQNLRIVKIDRGRNLLYVLGAVPGNKGNFVEVRDAVKKPLWKTELVLDEIGRPPVPTFEYETEIDGTGNSGHDIWMPMPKRDPLLPDDEDEAA